MMQFLKRMMPNGYNYQRECIHIALVYLCIGVLWILFSDSFAFSVASDTTAFRIINSYKGLFYVAITSIVLYLLLQRLMKKVDQREKENLYLSYNDVLTGTYNRRYYEMEIQRLDTETNLPISVIMADVNGLKMINDAFGHQTGDRLLCRSAEIIRSLCRPQDILVRWGGDEFILLMPNTACREAENLVGKIKESCIRESEAMFQAGISLGRATKISAEMEFAEVLKNAEDDLYRYKVIQNEGLRGKLINTIIKALHEKNPREEKHSERVGEVAQKIGVAIGFSQIEASKLKLIGHLHDIGKIAIEDGILNKEEKLTEREQEEVRRHPDVGFRILSASNEMIDLADCVLAHHERWDGKGYPRGLSGEEIPVEARIIALADSYDAMSSERPYRKALDEAVILYEIKRNAGLQFDPDIARIFVEKVLLRPWDDVANGMKLYPSQEEMRGEKF